MQKFLHIRENRYVFKDIAVNSVSKPHKRKRTMRKTLRISSLVIVLACSVRANDIIQNGIVSTPPPQPVNESQNSQPIESPITEILLNLLQSVRVLF
jgi:hypothetical protein